MIFSEVFLKRANACRFHYRNTKLKLDLRNQKTISLLITVDVSLNNQGHKFVDRSDLETTIFESYPTKSFNYTAIILFLHKLSTSKRTDITLQTSVKWLRVTTTCSTSILDSWYDNSIVTLFGNVHWPITLAKRWPITLAKQYRSEAKKRRSGIRKKG